jgi:leucyl-tRNA synthetase
MKILHKTIKKVQDDIDNFSFNTAVPAFMIAVNEFTKAKVHNKEILEPFCVILSPFAPHLSEELWSVLGHQPSVVDAKWPAFDETYLKEDSFEYPVMINGKMRTKITFDLNANQDEMLKTILSNEIVQKWTEGNSPKKSIIVPGKIINLVI